MCTPMCLCEVRYEDLFLRDLVRRLVFVMALAERADVPARFLEDVRRALERRRRNRAGASAR